MKKSGNFENLKRKSLDNLLIIKAFCGTDGTRTRDPLRDRQVF